MWVKTSKKGMTTVELSQPDRKALAAAHGVLEQIAYHHRNAPDHVRWQKLAADVLTLLGYDVIEIARPESKEDDV